MARNIPKIREDLVYFPDPDDPSKYLVKDPVRRQFFRYNALQVEMMKALDGRRSLEQVSALLEEKFDAEVPVSAIKRFVTRVEGNLLLDVTSYSIDDDKTRKQVLQHLEKKGFALRVKARDGASEEGKLFEAGTHELHEGDPCKAAALFDRVLEVNPANERAKQILLAIHEAFFKTKTESPSHAKLLHLFNPDKTLAVMDRICGRFFFSTWGALFCLAIILLGIEPAITVYSAPEATAMPGLTDLLVFWFSYELMVLFHEFCHGFATKHYGGTVDDLGWMWLYGSVLPGGYCDTTDSYTFKGKLPRIVVQFAGPLGSLVQQCLLYMLLEMMDPSVAVWQGLALANGYLLYINFLSVIPFVKYDAYYALSEYVSITNLIERALGHFRAVLSRAFLGVDIPQPPSTPRERRIFIFFSFGAIIYRVGLTYRIFIAFLLPLAVEHLGRVGLVIAAFYIYRSVGKPVFRALVRFVRFLRLHRTQIFRPARSAVLAGVTGLLVWGLASPWPFNVEGDVLIEPKLRAEVRVMEPGLVSEVLVREGDRVEAGATIARLRADDLVRDLTFAQQELAIAQSQLELLKRGARREEVLLVAARARAGQVRSNAASDRLSDAQRLRSLEVDSAGSVMAARRAASSADGEARVTEASADIVRAGARAEDVTEAEAQVRLLQSKVDDLEQRASRLEIKAPTGGIVTTKRLEESLGKWLDAGAELLTIHDTSSWRAHVTPHKGEPLAGIQVGQRILLGVAGDPGNTVEVTIEEIHPPPDPNSPFLIYTSSFTQPAWRGGMTGRARIYAPKRSVGFRVFVLPLVRLVEQELPGIAAI